MDLLLPIKKLLNYFYERTPFNSFYEQQLTSNLPPPIIILAVKGGVGKTLFTANLAMKLAQITNDKIAILDADMENPAIIRYLNLLGKESKKDKTTGKLLPVLFKHNHIKLYIHSMGTWLMDSPRRAMYFDGKTIQNHLIDAIFGVQWPKPKYFLVDMPPTMSDEFIVLRNVFPKIGGVILIGTSELQSVDGCERSLNMCIQHGIKLIGLVENKSSEESDCCKANLVCQNCGKVQKLYQKDGIKKLALLYNKPFLGSIPFNPAINRNNPKKFIYNDYHVFLKTAKEVIKYQQSSNTS